MICFTKSHIDSPKNLDLNGKSQVDTKLSESSYHLPNLGMCNHKTCYWIYCI